MNQNTNTEDTIDLKELFFSLIAQWKLIALCVILSLVCALLYLRATPDTYSVNALVQVEESKGTSAALLGDLSNMIDQKQPAQAEIEILDKQAKELGLNRSEFIRRMCCSKSKEGAIETNSGCMAAKEKSLS